MKNDMGSKCPHGVDMLLGVQCWKCAGEILTEENAFEGAVYATKKKPQVINYLGKTRHCKRPNCSAEEVIYI